MNYLDYINSIPMYQDGGSTPNPWKEFAKDITPGLGTYRAYQRAKEDPRFGTYADLGLSAVGDVATLFGVGAAIKGISAANKANKARKLGKAAFNTYNNMVRTPGVSKKVLDNTIDAINRGAGDALYLRGVADDALHRGINAAGVGITTGVVPDAARLSDQLWKQRKQQNWQDFRNQQNQEYMEWYNSVHQDEE